MLKVLIADDEERICKLIQILADWKALDMTVVATAGNGLEALRLLALHQPDVLVTDIRMPGCDGLELISRARELQPELEMVIISGYAQFEYAKTSIQFGVSDYLLKPVNKQELNSALEKCGRRCRERRGFQRERADLEKTSRDDSALLRDKLISDLLAHNLSKPDCQLLAESYRFSAMGEVQAFILQIDSTELNGEAMRLIHTRIGEVLRGNLGGICRDLLLAFREYTIYGIVSCDPKNRSVLRRGLRTCWNQLDARRALLGGVQFTLALGSRETAEELPASFHNARTAVMERLTEGTGRVLEGIAETAVLPKEQLLQQYGKTVGQAMELMDQELSQKAVDTLREDALSVRDVGGRELMDLIRAAADLFTARIGAADREATLREFYREASRASSATALFATLGALQERLLAPRIAARSSDEGRPVRTAKRYIQQHFAEAITLEAVAEATGFSVSYFSTMFKKETGEGFNKYLTRIRMEEAKTRLRETSVPVVEICRQVGYNDLKHFTHTFHKTTGLTPGEYRKLYG